MFLNGCEKTGRNTLPDLDYPFWRCVDGLEVVGDLVDHVIELRNENRH